MTDAADMDDRPPEWIQLGATEEFAAGELHERCPPERPELSLIVLREPGGRVHAWLNVCPHQGRPLNFAPDRFLRTEGGAVVCAAHGATFALPGGECIDGPCRGQGLRRLPARVGDDGRVAVDAGGIPRIGD